MTPGEGMQVEAVRPVKAPGLGHGFRSRRPPAIRAQRLTCRTRSSDDRLSDDGAAFRYAGLTQQHRITDCDPASDSASPLDICVGSDAAAPTHRNAILVLDQVLDRVRELACNPW